MNLAAYLKQELSGTTAYEWSIDVSYTGSTYINYQYGTEDQEDEGCDVEATIRFADHSRPPVVSDGGVFDHNYLKDFRAGSGIQKGYVDAILLYVDDLLQDAQKDLENDGNGYISWNNNEFTDVLDRIKSKDKYDRELLDLEGS